MIAVFFKNNKTEHEAEDAVVAQGVDALRNRMNHMLREEQKHAWAPAPTQVSNVSHISTAPVVKKRVTRERQFTFQVDLARAV